MNHVTQHNHKLVHRCQHKRKYPSLEAALKAKADPDNPDRDKPTCRYCGQYHLGSVFTALKLNQHTIENEATPPNYHPRRMRRSTRHRLAA